MAGGKHVSPEDGSTMRDLHDRGYFAGLIAEQYDVSEQTVHYHVHGHCAHGFD
jgi:hypothetical protein